MSYLGYVRLKNKWFNLEIISVLMIVIISIGLKIGPTTKLKNPFWQEVLNAWKKFTRNDSR
jgi:hypothetical protein